MILQSIIWGLALTSFFFYRKLPEWLQILLWVSTLIVSIYSVLTMSTDTTTFVALGALVGINVYEETRNISSFWRGTLISLALIALYWMIVVIEVIIASLISVLL